MLRNRRRRYNEAELDITSFMNLMIVLVPVLLMSMVFSHIRVLDLTLPDGSTGEDDNKENRILELVIRDQYMDINYPQGILLKRISKVDGDHNFEMLSTYLQEIKRQLREKDIEKKDILFLSEPNTDYQTIVSAMDTARSFPTIVAMSVVQAELFPDISMGDAPEADKNFTQQVSALAP